MINLFKKRTLIPLLKWLGSPLSIFFILWIFQNAWFAFIVGAIVLFLTKSEKITEEVLDISDKTILTPKETSDRTIRVVFGKFIVYAVIFIYLLIPLAFYLQQEYKIKLLSKETVKYFQSND